MTYLKIKVGYDAYFCFGYDNIGQDWTSLDKIGQVKPKRGFSDFLSLLT